METKAFDVKIKALGNCCYRKGKIGENLMFSTFSYHPNINKALRNMK